MCYGPWARPYEDPCLLGSRPGGQTCLRHRHVVLLLRASVVVEVQEVEGGLLRQAWAVEEVRQRLASVAEGAHRFLALEAAAGLR